MWICIHKTRQCLRHVVEMTCYGFNCFLFVQEVVDAALLENVETSIERNKSLQMLDIRTEHDNVVDAVIKGACRNTSLKKLIILYSVQVRLKAAAAELRRVRPQLIQKFIIL